MSDAKKRVLFVAYYFPPRGGAGVQRSLKFVKYLRQFDWEPTVLTTEYEKRSAAYDETLLGELPEGLEVIRVRSLESFFVKVSKVGLGRIPGMLLRPDTQVTWVRKALASAMKLHAKRPFDLVYTSVQPWSAGLVGMNFKAVTGLPWVSDFRDPWTRSLHLVWPTKSHWKSDRNLEGRYLAEADRSITVTATMREDFLADHPAVDPGRVTVIDNGYDTEDMKAPAAEDDGKFTVAFVGKFQYDHDSGNPRAGFLERLKTAGTFARRDVALDTHSPVYFFRGLADFLKRFPDRRAKVRVVLAGSTGRGNEALAGQLGLRDVVEFAGYLPHVEAVSVTRSADALLLPMFSTADAGERVAYASGKIFEYLAARKPILTLAQTGDARDIAERSGLGLAVAPRDVAGISQAIEKLYDNWADKGEAFAADEEFVARFTRLSLTRRLADTFNEVLRESGDRA